MQRNYKSPSKSPNRTPIKTPKKAVSRPSTPLKSSKFAPNSTMASSTTSESNHYFCHYKNAMYMGGIKSFQKHGRGIIIHDNGASVISEYHNDMKNGHNIVIYEHCILSIFYNKNRVQELAMRIPNYLILLRFGTSSGVLGTHSSEQPDGKGVLLDYSMRNIIYFTYRKGSITDKRSQEDSTILGKIFDLEAIQLLIGSEHANAIKLDIRKDESINIAKSTHKLNFGFYRKGLLNGLGVTISTKDFNNIGSYNLDTHRRNDQFYIKTIERGYFINSQLCGMGEKYFKNGNMYVGDFKNDIFEGRGILKNNVKKNWVFGEFDGGNLCEMLDYSHEGDSRKCEKLVEAMHERKNSWMDKQIDLAEPGMFIDHIRKIFESNPKQKIKSLQEKKQEVLRKIQENFMCEESQNGYPSSSNRDQDSYSQHNTKGTDFRGFAEQFIPNQEQKPSSTYEQPLKTNKKPNVYATQEQQSPRTYSSPNQSVSVNNSSKNYRHAPLFEKTAKPSSEQAQPVIKVHEIPTTKGSSDRQHRNQVYTKDYEFAKTHSPMQKLEESNVSDKQIYNTSQGRPIRHHHNSNINKLILDRNRYTKRSQVSQIGDESPTFNLDSKRIISRSRIFKYLNNDDVEEPPKFSYTPIQ